MRTIGVIVLFLYFMLLVPLYKAFIIVFPYLVKDLFFVILTVVLIVTFIYLDRKQLLNKYSSSMVIFAYMLTAFPIIIYNMQNHIEKISMKRFGIAPQCISIDFNVYRDFRGAHAIVAKDKNYYYWSFRENDFMENNNIQNCF